MSDEIEYNSKPRAFWFPSCAGAIVFGILIPVLLTDWHISFVRPDSADIDRNHPWTVFIAHEGFCLLLGGAWSFLLAYLLRDAFDGRPATTPADLNRLVRIGLLFGIAGAFINFPVWLLMYLDHLDWSRRHEFWRAVSLLAVSGATTGSWVAWQAFRHKKSKLGLWPRFNPLVWILLVASWIAVISFFVPPVPAPQKPLPAEAVPPQDVR